MRSKLLKRILTLVTGGIVVVLLMFGLNAIVLNIVKNDKVQRDKHLRKGEQAYNEVSNRSIQVISINCETTETVDSKLNALKNIVFQIAKDLYTTKTHIRGTKARRSILQAISGMTKLLQLTNISITEVQRPTLPSKHICEEIYMGAMYGYPSYNKGFERVNCSFVTPIEDLVTIVVLQRDEPPSSITSIIHGIQQYNNRIKVIVGIPELAKIPTSAKIGDTIFHNISANVSNGKAWNYLMERVGTEYAFVATNITHFNFDARLERLVFGIDSLNVSVAGGASRDQNGFWEIGCFQTAFKNYSLIYEEGYDESLHECIFCDFINGPFLIRTNTIKKYIFDEKMTSSSLFYDFFLRLSENKHESIICPDSMFYVHRTRQEDFSDALTDLADKYNLYRLKFADKFDVSFSCNRGTVKCRMVQGYAIHPCCLQELTDTVKLTMKLCVESGIICELQAGTLLGAVKFGKTLPWERDGDLKFLVSNESAFLNLKQQLMKRYKFVDTNLRKKLGGLFRVHSSNWHVELEGYHMLDTSMLLADGMKPTKVLVDGQWMFAPRNPGFNVRNAYGLEIYAHAQHWMVLRIPMMGNYPADPASTFTQCSSPGRHNCLDNFNADGNLQFNNHIP